jgi:hypothetical protein
MTKRDDDPHGTRDKLARSTIRLVSVAAIAVIGILAAEKPLALTPETVKTLEQLTFSLFGLGGIVLSFYFMRRP